MAGRIFCKPFTREKNFIVDVIPEEEENLLSSLNHSLHSSLHSPLRANHAMSHLLSEVKHALHIGEVRPSRHLFPNFAHFLVAHSPQTTLSALRRRRMLHRLRTRRRRPGRTG